MFRRFRLNRNYDVSGISGIGIIAEGIQFSDGQVILRWQTTTATTEVSNNIDELMTIHGHEGSTEVVWLD